MAFARTRHVLTRQLAYVGMGLSYLCLAQPAWANKEQPPDAVEPDKPLNLLLTRDELRAINGRYSWVVPGGDEDDRDQVTVTAPAELLPMRDVTRDVWGGLAAPFWAIKNPKEAWRIFVPIPPKPGRG